MHVKIGVHALLSYVCGCPTLALIYAVLVSMDHQELAGAYVLDYSKHTPFTDLQGFWSGAPFPTFSLYALCY